MEKQTKIPKLRFHEFSDAWEKKKLKETILMIVDNRGKTPPVCNDGEIPLLEITSMGNFHIDYSKVEKFVDKTTYNTWFRKYLQKGDVLFSTVGARAGICSYYNETIVSSVAQNIIGIRFKKDYSVFMYYLLTERRNNCNIKSIQMTGAQPSIKVPQLTELHFSLPTFNEQIKIGSFINAVDDKLSELKKKKSLLEQYKKGIMQKLFSQELRLKDEKGNDFAKWEEKKIKDVLTIGSGKDYKQLKMGEVPVFGTGGLMTFVDSWLYDGDTVCIGRKGTIDKPMFYSGKIWTVDTLFYTHSFVLSVPKFIYYVFQGINWKEYNEASGVPSLSKSTIEKIAIALPSLPEQTKIANFLSAIDDKINYCGVQIEKIEGWKKGLLQKMFV